jgi:rsbT co-antagonist protein RsbR
MGAETIVTGLSSEIAQTLVDLEVELARMKTVGDLQGGLEEAERLLGQPPDERPHTKQSPEE